MLLTKAHGRVLTPGLTWLDHLLPVDVARRNELALAWRRLDKALDLFIDNQMVAA
ncbi:MAG: hypothetical protein ACRD2W_09735 [Acidimicrobiales bacterium]